MNKAAIKTFAIEARKKLIASVKDKAGLLGISSEGCSKPVQKGAGFEVYLTSAETENKIFEKEIKQRQSLANRIAEKGYDHVMEEVAYTWFNRIIAIRFMEVNDYLPTRIRVLSSEIENKTEPDIVTQASDIDLDFTDTEKEKIYMLKSENKFDELFGMLFIKQCNKLGQILPELFEKVSDYTELLLNVSYTNKDGIIRILVDNIEEDDFKDQVEIIGWLYQYYNTEVKDETFSMLKKNIKIAKERIPAATQLFTPDWIVRYMVENSLGRLWIEHLQSENKQENNDKIKFLKSTWKYYLDEAKQQEDVKKQLDTTREEYKSIKLENIKVIDPCMGSGHILVYAFDVLIQIYESCGYSKHDAARSIIENNLYGMDIDNRAYQLAYFAVTMKARQYNRRIINGKTSCHIYSIEESNDINREQLQYFGHGMSNLERNDVLNQLKHLLDAMYDAKDYGSILSIDNLNWDLLHNFVRNIKADGQMTFDTNGLDDTQIKLHQLIEIGEVMAYKYDVVITNPPYMGGKGMSEKLSSYVKRYYDDSKSDLYSVFIEKCNIMLTTIGYQSMITQHSWMFLATYETFRKNVILKNRIVNMVHLGPRAFEEISGEVVQTVAFTLNKTNIPFYNTTYLRLVDYSSQSNKEVAYLKKNDIYLITKEAFSEIPGSPIVYWLSDKVLNIFSSTDKLEKYGYTKGGMGTSDNDRFLRHWFEISNKKIAWGTNNHTESMKSNKKWFPYHKGGTYRKWYGNNDYMINWENNGYEVKELATKLYKSYSRTVKNIDSFFLEGATWSSLATKFAMRYSPSGFIFDSKGSMLFANEKGNLLPIIGFLNSKIAKTLLSMLSPTLDFSGGALSKLTYLQEIINPNVTMLVNYNIQMSKMDWDFFETSWDFKKHPLIPNRDEKSENQNVKKHKLIKISFESWKKLTDRQFMQLKLNEEELNSIFIQIYGLKDELTPKVEDKDVTIRKAELGRDIRSLISYAVGCIFGRYSLDVDGLVYAGGNWEENLTCSKYKTFIPDKDNIILISEEEYFEDDIVGLFVKFVKTVYGKETLEENLDFIAQALGNKGVSSREVIRNYFVKDFYNDHLKVYQKRPIYWQFNSGKENGFKALIYMHRYEKDTVGRVRADYLHKVQTALENSIKSTNYIIETTSSNVDKSKAAKSREKYIKQLAETRVYDEALAHIAHQRIDINLDDGVKENYAKFQNVEVSSEGKKTQKINLLTEI